MMKFMEPNCGAMSQVRGNGQVGMDRGPEKICVGSCYLKMCRTCLIPSHVYTHIYIRIDVRI